MLRRIVALCLLLTAVPLCAQEQNKTADEQKEPNRAVQFVQDLLEDAYPFTIDFGAEPGQHGSTVFVRAQYNWNDRFASNVTFSYGSQNLVVDDFDAATKGILQSSNKLYGVQLYPLVMYVGDTRASAPTPLVELKVGVMYNHLTQKTMTGLFDTTGALLGEANAGKYFSIGSTFAANIVGPQCGYSVQFPIFRYLTLGYEGTISPIYFLYYHGTVSYASLQTDPIYNESLDYTGQSWSLPSVSQTLYADICRYVRVKTRFEYTRLSREATEEDQTSTQHSLSLRYGFELVKPSKTTRKKASHLWAGIYYQHEWNKADGDFTRTDGWVLCFGA